ncbi:uncharacterized protein FOMMEDRAFT_145449 [Fomitiporia mediterranea MF3/22]|uniref:uncharacterized protein n=1 Tax=Fomitiporia mediterranea (strain MF3/22) TaxID=694068 RepID=UPI0004408D83|nr:uncharacterized protein FOMMEDRAFT_145449 [Fomitiporia mediterranea MF3/22]EJD06192.1 hypothetical protein FOMMEDRAFT_145449 [Fomitiporia mediterranea MF3/22]
MSSVEEALSLVPRAYQEEIFEQAQNGNVIAALDTGSGKTFIAALLIKWVMSQPSQAGKKTVFLVPKVPLVDQQRDVLSKQTPLIVRGYVGAMGVDAWDKGRWELEFLQSDCLVMTAQIFKNILVHGYWSLDQVALLIFDECHHARKYHPYNAIMVDHYRSSEWKPKIFGMTASPIWNREKPLESIETLQNNLCSKVIAVRQHMDLLDQHVNRPIELIVRYQNPSDEHYDTYYKPSLWDYLHSDEQVISPILAIRDAEVRYKVTLNAVGPAGADYFLLKHAIHAVEEYELRAMMPEISSRSRKKASFTSDTISDSGRNDDNELAIGLEKLRSAVLSFRRRLLSDGRTLPPEWLSPKLRAAVDILVKHRSESFQGIIFVNQRQVAKALSWILGRVLETKTWLRCGELIGHGESSKSSSSGKGMDIKRQRDIVQSFRSGNLNLLIATDVGEEGLDFPACALVIRYDSVKHMVGYVQSRGRARQQNSTYVVMAAENDAQEIARYKGLRNAEPELRIVYQTMNAGGSSGELDNGDELDNDYVDPLDLASRETYTIPSTGATLTYSSAISLLSHFCSLIPGDSYTRSLQPKYIIESADKTEFTATLHLPRALPLTSDQLLYNGPPKRSKKEAKRAVAFIAMRMLHTLGIFDDYLSPIKSRKGMSIEDADGRPIAKVNAVGVMMDVLVASPWSTGPPWHLHVLRINDKFHAGLVCGRSLPEVDLVTRGKYVQVHSQASVLPFDLTLVQLDLLEKFTRMGIWWRVTGSPVTSPVACFLVPLDQQGNIDWSAIERAVTNEIGTYDWSDVKDNDEGKVMLMNSRRVGRVLRFIRFRPDLSVDTKPSPTTIEGSFDTYAAYFEAKYSFKYKKTEHVRIVATASGRIVEVSEMPRYPSSGYNFRVSRPQQDAYDTQQSMATFLLPESYCRRALFHMDIVEAFQVFASACQRVCDVFRARVARNFLKYPPIPDNLIVEALTLPSAMAGFNNQRLETMGDSVLKLSVVVYIFNAFPNRHEGQLTALKENSVSNRLLLARAKEVHLERFLTSENRSMRTWRFERSSVTSLGTCKIGSEEIALAHRTFPRRSLQDCMEASLGAAYVAGGLNFALQTGTALGLCFGGPTPWPERYPLTEFVPPAALFGKLQEDLQYTFRNGKLLVEAVKHPSFDFLENYPCYQRLEFLGDAVIELVVTTYLYNKFPGANSGQMSWARARAICNTTLAALAVNRLSLHKYLLANCVELSEDVAKEVEILSAASYEDVSLNDWRYDPPKVLGDIFESVIGAVFVDSGFDYTITAPIIEELMKDVLVLLHPDIPYDPVSRLLQWVAKSGCMRAKFQRTQTNPRVNRKDGVVVLIHDRIVAGPITAANKPLAKGLVAEKAMQVLADGSSEFALRKICECMRVEDEEEPRDLPERNTREKDLDLETTEGFLRAGSVRLSEVEADELAKEVEEMNDDSESWELEEVELLLDTSSGPASEVDGMDCS